ncbi:hypothetical protein K469DRAFT_803154 [Zopfia rhizophila CBS 207.26]|uniref:Uncharacterized protein n=1 Tax=Zopfia rhizophila CBS 207.26 TaxID=1314779 RepID=A0A6A6DKF5_9PEZI|nr:hypothetical protein K469DRAFT_803154 [Zopfia rhizophila CBS 207.26]
MKQTVITTHLIMYLSSHYLQAIINSIHVQDNIYEYFQLPRHNLHDLCVPRNPGSHRRAGYSRTWTILARAMVPSPRVAMTRTTWRTWLIRKLRTSADDLRRENSLRTSPFSTRCKWKTDMTMVVWTFFGFFSDFSRFADGCVAATSSHRCISLAGRVVGTMHLKTRPSNLASFLL